MSIFEYRTKIEGWFEGLFDTFESYIRSVLFLNFRLRKSVWLLSSTKEVLPEFSSPAVFFVISYLIMCFLIRDVDFTDPVFGWDLSQRLHVLGVLGAAKKVDIDALMVYLLPAILLLFVFVYPSRWLLSLGGDNGHIPLLRRNYAFMLGGCFLTVGFMCGGYEHLVKPLAQRSWWLGLPVHILTLLPLIGAIVPSVAIQHIRTQNLERRFWARTAATIVPWLGVLLINYYLGGSFSIMNYLRLF